MCKKQTATLQQLRLPTLITHACVAFFLGLSLAMAPLHAQEVNPPADGFDLAGSDVKAIALADRVMMAQGGRKNWDEARYFQWTFFGARTLTWDKWTGDCRIEWLKRPQKVIVNIHSGAGMVELAGKQQDHPDSLKKYLEIGKKVWINDAYWLFMPFKLKDSGLTLKLLSDQDTTLDGRAAWKLQLTFKGVGVTPDNKYHVWIDKESELVSQWAFFERFELEKPGFITPWDNYALCGKLKLSSGRGKERAQAISNVQCPESLPSLWFKQF